MILGLHAVGTRGIVKLRIFVHHSSPPSLCSQPRHFCPFHPTTTCLKAYEQCDRPAPSVMIDLSLQRGNWRSGLHLPVSSRPECCRLGPPRSAVQTYDVAVKDHHFFTSLVHKCTFPQRACNSLSSTLSPNHLAGAAFLSPEQPGNHHLCESEGLRLMCPV